MALIWWLSSRADPLGAALKHPLDWAAHVLSYAVLGFYLGRASGPPGGRLGAGAGFGAFDEVHQAFVPGREAGTVNW